MPDLNAWIAANGDHGLLLDYLVETGVVIDVGGHKGLWASRILSRMGPSAKLYVFEPVREFYEAAKEILKDPRVELMPLALSDHDEITSIAINGDRSSLHSDAAGPSTHSEEIETMDAETFFLGLGEVELISINIEGHEFTLLPHMIDTGIIKQCKNVQVQFHDCYPGSYSARDAIRKALSLTHTESWCYPFVWESWRVK